LTDSQPKLIALTSSFEEKNKIAYAQRKELNEKALKLESDKIEWDSELQIVSEKVDKLESCIKSEHEKRNKELQQSIQQVEDIEIEILNMEDCYAQELRMAESKLQQHDDE
jgi:hypothetical protein